MTSRPFGALLLLIAAMAGVRTSTQELQVPFAVAVWGYNDALIPFADFDGRTWRKIWSEPVNARWDDVPLLRELPPKWWGRTVFQPSWEMLTEGGERIGSRVIATAPADLGSSCAVNVGLKTDYPKSLKPESAMAASQPGVLTAIERVSTTGADARDLQGVLAWILQTREARAVLEARRELPRPRDVAWDLVTAVEAWLWRESSTSEFQARADYPGC